MDIHRCSFLDYTPESITSTSFSHESTNEVANKNLRLAVGRADGAIEIWNPNPVLKRSTVQSGNGDNISSRTQWTLETNIPGSIGSSVEGIVWSSKLDPTQPPRLFSIGGSTYLTEWDIATGMPLVNHDCNAGVIWSLSIDSNHEKIALGCEDGSVVVVNINGGKGVIEHETILQRQKHRVLSLCWTEDEVIGGCSDGRIRVWSYKTNNSISNDDEANGEGNEDNYRGRLIQQLRVDRAKGEPTLIWSLVYIPQIKQFVSGDSTGSIKFWNLKHLVLQQSFQVHEADVLCLASNFKGTKVFSAGVDRKVFEFDYTKVSKQNYKWVNLTNRLLHGNDIRALTSYQSKDLDLFVSAGVERVLHVNSMEDFPTSETIKLPINPLNKNILLVKSKKWIVMWQKNTVKIWKLLEDKSKKLKLKMVLQDPEFINDISVSKNGNYIVIGRISTTKIFELKEDDKKIEVKRLNSELLAAIGTKLVRFSDETKSIIAYTSDNELFKFQFNSNKHNNEFDDNQQSYEFDLPEDSLSSDSHNYMSTYTKSVLNSDGSLIALSKPNGVIDIFNLKTTSSNPSKLSQRLIKFSSTTPPTAIEFSSLSTLLVVTLDHTVHEFNITLASTQAVAEKTELYTSWSKQNSNKMPHAFINLKGDAKGIFTINSKYWVWGQNWISFFDSSEKLVDNSRGEKRNRNGSSVANNNNHSNSNNQQEQQNERAFWFTKNYTDLIFVDNLSDSELIVVERHLEDLPIPPAFKLAKYAI